MTSLLLENVVNSRQHMPGFNTGILLLRIFPQTWQKYTVQLAIINLTVIKVASNGQFLRFHCIGLMIFMSSRFPTITFGYPCAKSGSAQLLASMSNWGASYQKQSFPSNVKILYETLHAMTDRQYAKGTSVLIVPDVELRVPSTIIYRDYSVSHTE